MKRFLLLLAAVLVFSHAAMAAGGAKINGWISDSMCGAKHMGDNPDCVRKCIKEMNAKPVFVDEAKKSVWAIDNPDAVKNFYGDKVTITATLDAAKKSVHIEAITAGK